MSWGQLVLGDVCTDWFVPSTLLTDYSSLNIEEVIPVVGVRKPLERKGVMDHLQKYGWWTPIRNDERLLSGSHVTPLLSVPGLIGRLEERAAGEWPCPCCGHVVVVPPSTESEAPAADPIRAFSPL